MILIDYAFTYRHVLEILGCLKFAWQILGHSCIAFARSISKNIRITLYFVTNETQFYIWYVLLPFKLFEDAYQDPFE